MRSGGIGFLGLLTIAFIVLKLTNTITWSWWFVLAPILWPLCIVGGMLLVAIFMSGVAQMLLLYYKRSH